MVTSDSDLVLLRRFTETRDPEAFARIVQRYAGAVYCTCQRILHDSSSAEDAAQETFYRLITRPQRVTESLGGWLHRAATRLALDARRCDVARRHRESNRLNCAVSEPSIWAEVAPHLDEALASLPQAERELLVRHFLRGEAQSDIAAETRTSTATLCRRMSGAIQSLRKELSRRGFSITPALLIPLLGGRAGLPPPATVRAALAKMTLYCTARCTAMPAAATASASSAAASDVSRWFGRARWAFASAGFSFAVTLAAALIVQRSNVAGRQGTRVHPAPQSVEFAVTSRCETAAR